MNNSLSRKALEQTVFYAALFSLLAHGYRFLNMSFSGDGTLISQAGEVAYQISLGRFLQPVFWQIRGSITAPLTIGLFATAGLIGSAVLVVSLLGLKTRLPILLTCGILAANETLAVSYATYLPWVDVYMIALFFAIAGVYVGVRFQYGHLLSPVFYCICSALYQSYLQAASSLIIILLILRLLRGEKTVSIWLEGIKSCLALVAGLLLYAGVLNLVLGAIDVRVDHGYNTIGAVGQISLDQVPTLLLETYRYPFAFFGRAADASFIPLPLTALLLALSGMAAFPFVRKLKAGGLLTLLFLVAVWPLGTNFVAFISRGIVHPLMVYSFFFLYIGCIGIQALPAASAPALLRLAAIRKAAAYGVASVMVFLCVITSNQLYLRRDLEFYSTTSAMTRILKHADSVPGYVPGETPVCILGYLPSSKIGFERPGFADLSNLQGMYYTYAASYESSTNWYLQMVLGYPVNLVSLAEQTAYSESGIGSSLPVFPDKGAYQIIDGTLFIRLF